MTTVIRQNIVGRPIGEPVQHDIAGETLAVLVDRYADSSRPFVVSVHRQGDLMRPDDATCRMRAVWASTVVQQDEIVLVTQLPLGGGSGAQIGMLIGILALSIFAPVLVAEFGGEAALFGTATSLNFVGKAIVAGPALGQGLFGSRIKCLH